jgi:hypothetical protein
VGRQENGRALAGRETGEVVAERGRGHRVEAGRRLVEEDEAGPMEEGPGYGQLLLHAAAPTARLFTPALPETEVAQELADASPAVRRAQAPDAAVVLEVVLGAEALVDPALLEQGPRESPDLAGARGHVAAEDLGPAAARLEKAEEEADGGRLAGPVRAEEAEDDAGRDLEVEALEGRDRLEVAAQLGRADDGF